MKSIGRIDIATRSNESNENCRMKPTLQSQSASRGRSLLMGVSALVFSLSASAYEINDPHWTKIADENQTISITDGAFVRFGQYDLNAPGTYGRWHHRGFVTGGNVTCNVQEFGDPFDGRVKRCEKLNNGWSYLALEGQSGYLNAGEYDLAYGAFSTDGIEDTWDYGRFKRTTVTVYYSHGEIPCNNTTFGKDPYPDRLKECFYRRR